jgi:hypothetical protein
VESPEHALLECPANPEVLALHNVFFEKLLRTVQKLREEMLQPSSIELLKAIIYQSLAIVLLGKFVHNILQIFYAILVYHARG